MASCLASLVASGCSSGQEVQPTTPEPEAQTSASEPEGVEGEAATAEYTLPADFQVYVQGSTVLNHPQEGFEARTLPTANAFSGSPGCYVACYSHDAESGVYQVGGNIYVNGQVRVEGSYNAERVCLPAGFEEADISAEQSFRDLCGENVETCGDGCWAGGDTGGWFGM